MSPHQLGKMLAQLLMASEDHEIHKKGNGDLEALKQRVQQLSSQSDVLSEILKIPDGLCVDGHPFLLNHHDFFVVYLILSQNQTHPDVNCSELTQHLNDCYRCFDVFSQTLHAFYQVVLNNKSKILAVETSDG